MNETGRSVISPEAALTQAFATAREQDRAAFIPYLTAGYPDEERFEEAALGILEVADILEVGLPYSDPLGDGPTIQRSGETVLRQGVTPARTLELVARLRKSSDKPIVIMTYYNPIYTFPGGEREFARAASRAGVNGLILPDLPPEEAGGLIAECRELGLATIFLVAPTSTDERIRTVTEACRGFVYAVSVLGVTGARGEVGSEVPELVARIKAHTELPVAVGFGVSSYATANGVAQVADGVVAGSALIRELGESVDEAQALAREIARGCVR